MFKPDQTDERQLFSFSIRELVPPSSDVWLYVDLFDELDLRAFDEDYSTQGEAGHEPRLILRTLFYGLTHGIATGRKLADACVHDCRYAVLSGQNHPSYRTFARFVIRHERRMEALFVQVVRLAQAMGLASLGRVAIDGSRFKAKTSKHKAMSYERMTRAVEQIKSELAVLKADLQKANSSETNEAKIPDEISLREKRLAKIQAAKAAIEREANEAGKVAPDPKAQKSFHDLEARGSTRANGAFMYAFNCQAVVDGDNQIVVAAEVHGSSHDGTAFAGMLDAVEATCGAKPGEILADSGYASNSNVRIADARGVRPYIATGRGESQSQNGTIKSIQYYPKTDQFRCRRGKNLKSISKCSSGKRGLAKPSAQCKGCPLRATCRLHGRAAKTIWIPDADHFVAARKHLRRMESPEGRAVYARRKVIVEPVFGNIKNKGMTIQRRGHAKASCWWKIACTAHNIEKLLKRR